MVVRTLRGPGVDVAIRADETRPGASLLKLALVGAVYDGAAAGALDLDARVPVERLTPTAHRTALAWLDPGHELSVRELCALALATSDNPSAQHLLGLVGIEAVNATAEAWGCSSTRLEAGFDDRSLGTAARRNVTSARDALAMLLTLAHDPAYAGTRPALANTVASFRLRLRLPLGTHVLHKTGSLAGVCHDTGLVLGERSELALAFLCEDQADTAACSVAIGDAALAIWSAVAY